MGVQPVVRLCRRFADPTCLPELRRWLRDALPPGDLETDAQLVCTELVTNALEHGAPPYEVRLAVAGRATVRVEVDDADGGAAVTVGRSRLGRLRGRGLILVEALASWGIVRDPADGKTVWAQLPVAAA